MSNVLTAVFRYFDDSVSGVVGPLPAPACMTPYGSLESVAFSGGEAQFYASDGGYVSKPSDNPANTYFPPAMTAPFSYSNRLWEGDLPSGRTIQAFGAIVLHNGDERFDDFLRAGVAGRRVEIYQGAKHAAYSTHSLVFRGRVEGPDWDLAEATIPLRSEESLFEQPISQSTYGGTGGRDGDAQLAGVNKPLCYGGVFNAPCLLIDQANGVYQVHDTTINAVSAVRDKGLALTLPSARDGGLADDYATYEALVAAATGDAGDSPAPDIAAGEYATCLAEGMIRTGGAADGQVTANLQGCAGGTGYVSTTPDIVQRIIESRLAGFSISIDSASFASTKADAIGGAAIGYFVPSGDDLSVGLVIDQLMAGVLGYGYFALDGSYKIGVISAPTGGTALATREIARADRLPRSGMRKPYWQVRVGYQRNNLLQSRDDLATSVSEANKQLYGQDASYKVADDTTIKRDYPTSERLTFQTFFASGSDATAFGTRFLALFGVLRDTYQATTRRDPFSIEVGEAISLTGADDRFNLGSAKSFLVKGIDADAGRGELTLELWG